MANRAIQNRPFKFGERDRREFIVEDSEVTFRAINNVAGSPVFYGRAKAGSEESEEKWQIRKIQYDDNEGVVTQTWPENDEGVASTEYEFAWSSNDVLTITNLTQANPCVCTVSSIGNLQNGDQIVIQFVAGMTQVNFNGSNIYTVANKSGNTFELQGINSSGYSAYVSGGEVNYGEVVGYTYV